MMTFSKCTLLVLMASISYAFSQEDGSLDEMAQVRRAEAHLLLGDHSKAIAELKVSLVKQPQSKKLRRVMIEALSRNGQDVDALKLFKESCLIFPELAQEDATLETLAWGVLQREEHSTHLIANVFTMIGASLTRDVKSIQILIKGLRSTNSYLRVMAVRLSAQYGDRILIEEIQKLLIKDPVWYVRLECMQTLSALHVESMRELLKEVLSSSRSSIEEKVVAIQAYLSLDTALSEAEMLSFLHSRRAGLRLLGCQMMLFLDRQDLIYNVLKLLDDPCQEVVIAAINTLALMQSPEIVKEEAIGRLKAKLGKHPYHIAVTSAWALTLLEDKEGLRALEHQLKSDEIEEARMAASALALTGKAGVPLATTILKSHKDPYVKATLAFGMLGYFKNPQMPSQALYQFLVSTQDKIMWDQNKNPLFQTLAPSDVRHRPEIAHFPSVVDDHTRLQLYNALAIMRFKDAQKGIKEYLKAHSLGMTFAASSVLIEEGAEDALDLIHQLLQDKDPLIQIQAALVLASLGNDQDAIDVLIKAYPDVDRDLKVHILEALGHLGSRDTIPFLAGLLTDHFHTIRILAASSLIQCLHH